VTVSFVRDLLVFFHLLGMATLVASFFLQLRAGLDQPLVKGWLHGGALQLVTGITLQLIEPATHADYNNAKLGIKLVVLLIIFGVVVFSMLRKTHAKWMPITLFSLVIVNVGLAVFWN
jgi:hypothetical protein